MEGRLLRQRRLSKELKRCLDLARLSMATTSSQATYPSERVAAKSRLSHTSNPELSLPLLSLSERRRASKQRKLDGLRAVAAPSASIREDVREQLATPKLESLRVRPQRAEKSPQALKYCAAKQCRPPPTPDRPPGPGSATLDLGAKGGLEQANPFKAMYSRLVQRSVRDYKQAAPASRAGAAGQGRTLQAGPRPRKSILPVFPPRPSTPLRAGIGRVG